VLIAAHEAASAYLPQESLPFGELETTLIAGAVLALAGFFAVLRAGLLHSVPSRLLEACRSDSERDRLRPLLENAEALATSASVFGITFQILFAFSALLLVVSLFGETLGALGIGLAASVPLLVVATEVLPNVLRTGASDRLLRAVLPTFEILQLPLASLVIGLEAVRRACMRLFRIPERPRSARQIVEGLRVVIEDSQREEDLQDGEREIIENVVDAHAVDVARVMTPRTEITAVEVDRGLLEVVRAIATSGHSRIPVYERSLDSIIGVAYAQEILTLVASGGLGSAELRPLLRPVPFVPETKRVPDLLSDFRRNRQKLAIVLDEYGGTAGIVTLGDIVAELVGEMREEHGELDPDPMRRLPDGRIEIRAITRVHDVNAAFQIDLPEDEDYETLGGFALAEFGRFPRVGESFEWDGVQFVVSEATDRRVLGLILRFPAEAGAKATLSA
jgi:CBS domain containing-hemolysin-like protein